MFPAFIAQTSAQAPSISHFLIIFFPATTHFLYSLALRLYLSITTQQTT